MNARDKVGGLSLQTWVTLAAAGVGLYVLVKALGGLKKVADGATTAAADAWVALTLPGALVPQGAVLLPNGTVVPMTQLSATGTVQPTTQTDGAPGATFVWQGARYYLNAPSDANGNWRADTTMGGAIDYGVTPSAAPGGW